mgnify:CR=1 FL=1
MKKEHEQFLSDVQKMANERGIKFFIASFDGDEAFYSSGCSQSDMAGMLVGIYNELPQIYEAIPHYMRTGDFLLK